MANNIMNRVTIKSATKDDWTKFLRHISSHNDATVRKLGGECYFDFNCIIPMPGSLNLPHGDDMYAVMDNAVAVAEQHIRSGKYTAAYYKKALDCYAVENNGIDALKKARQARENHTYLTFSNYIEFTANNYYRQYEKAKSPYSHVAECMESAECKDDAYFKIGMAYLDNIIEHGAATWSDWCDKNWDTKCSAYECWLEKPNNELDDRTELSFTTAWTMPRNVFRQLSKQLPRLTFIVKYADEAFDEHCGEIEFHNGEEKELRPGMNKEQSYLFSCEVWDEEPGWDDEDC